MQPKKKYKSIYPFIVLFVLVLYVFMCLYSQVDEGYHVDDFCCSNLKTCLYNLHTYALTYFRHRIASIIWDDHLLYRDLLEAELEAVGIRLNKLKPNLYYKQKKAGGIKFTATCNLTKCDEKMVQNILHDFSILCRHKCQLGHCLNNLELAGIIHITNGKRMTVLD